MKITNDQRRAIAAAWHAARECGEDQASFCARQVPPIRPRTLRQWVKNFGSASSDAAPGSDLRLIHAALANLHLLADLLERSRIDMPPRCDPDPGCGPNDPAHNASATRSAPHSGMPPARASEIASPSSVRFWDET